MHHSSSYNSNSSNRRRLAMSTSTEPIGTLELSKTDDSEEYVNEMKSGKGHPRSFWEKFLPSWNGKNEFFLSQIKVAGVLFVAWFGDRWEPSYPRNDNHNMALFWFFHFVLAIASVATWKHIPARDPSSTRITLLSRPQTEEWKGWMQFSFIMYHYYRAFSVYNWIRVFVSSYVWMVRLRLYFFFHRQMFISIQISSLTQYVFLLNRLDLVISYTLIRKKTLASRELCRCGCALTIFQFC
jgi:hypothetical protein